VEIHPVFGNDDDMDNNSNGDDAVSYDNNDDDDDTDDFANGQGEVADSDGDEGSVLI